MPQPFFFKSWFQSSVVETEEAEEEDEDPLVEVEVELEKITATPKSPQKHDEKLEKRKPGKQKQGSPPVKLEKTKSDKTSKEPVLPKGQDQSSKAVKPLKRNKEVYVKKEEKFFENKKQRAGSLLPLKRKVILKDHAKQIEPHKQGKEKRGRKPIESQKEELKHSLRKGQSKNQGRQEHKLPRKENPRGLNGSSRLQSQRKFFPQKDEDRYLSPKNKHGVYKTLD